MNVKVFALLLFLAGPFLAFSQLTGNAAAGYVKDAPVSTDKRIHLHVDQVPLFAGCKQENVFTLEEQFCSIEKINAFVQENLRYPEAAKAAGIAGKVEIRAIIEPDGAVSGARILKSVDKSLNEEAVRVVMAMPHFTPATLKQERVRAFKDITIEFQ